MFAVKLDGESEDEIVIISERKNSPDPPELNKKKKESNAQLIFNIFTTLAISIIVMASKQYSSF